MTFSEWYAVQDKWTSQQIVQNGWSIIFQVLDDTLGDYELVSDVRTFEKRFSSRLTHITAEFADILNGETLADVHTKYTMEVKNTTYGNGINDTVLGTPTTALGLAETVSKDSRGVLSYIRSRYGMITVEDFIKVRFKDLFLLVY